MNSSISKKNIFQCNMLQLCLLTFPDHGGHCKKLSTTLTKVTRSTLPKSAPPSVLEEELQVRCSQAHPSKPKKQFCNTIFKNLKSLQKLQKLVISNLFITLALHLLNFWFSPDTAEFQYTNSGSWLSSPTYQFT